MTGDDARPVSPSLWAALRVVAENDPLPTVVARRAPIGPRAIHRIQANALVRRGFIAPLTDLGPRAVLTPAGATALETHDRIEAHRRTAEDRDGSDEALDR